MDNRRRGVRRVADIVIIAVVVALVWVLFTTVWLWRNQERIVFQPQAVHVSAPAPAERVEYAASDGHSLYGYLLRPGRDRGGLAAESLAARIVVVAFHGNADLAVWLVPWGRELADRTGATVLLAEYRGYGGISGSPTYETAAADARGAIQFVRASLRPEGIVLFGHSLGSAVAADAAVFMSPEAPRALVLQSPFTSARDMATRLLVAPIPWLWQRISRVHYDTRSIVARLESPIWVAHGSRDMVIPTRMGRQVFGAARRPAELLIVEGAGHNDVADVGGERYWNWLEKAVTSH